jgi:hypothetical protein
MSFLDLHKVFAAQLREAIAELEQQLAMLQALISHKATAIVALCGVLGDD